MESVTFSNDNRFVAAGNLMGEVRVWNVASGDMVSNWEDRSLHGWGIIKGHYYTGGVFSLAFVPDDSELYLSGMGTTRDPAAGNGKQLWGILGVEQYRTENDRNQCRQYRPGSHGDHSIRSVGTILRDGRPPV